MRTKTILSTLFLNTALVLPIGCADDTGSTGPTVEISGLSLYGPYIESACERVHECGAIGQDEIAGCASANSAEFCRKSDGLCETILQLAEGAVEACMDGLDAQECGQVIAGEWPEACLLDRRMPPVAITL